jgi:hypothetical protein
MRLITPSNQRNDDRARAEDEEMTVSPQTRLLALLFAALKEILENTLVEAAKSKGDDGLAWLDRYESEIIFLAKQTHSEGLALEDEAKDVGNLINVLKLIFATARRRLTEGANKD